MFIQSLLLGVVQGLTEFLPVSSSAHLALFQHYLGWSEPALTFDIFLHLATMIATIVYFRSDLIRLSSQWFKGCVIKEYRSSKGWTLGWAMIGGTIATVIIGLPLKPFVEKFSTSVPFVGIFLLITASLLWLASISSDKGGELTLLKGIFIGVAQGLAVMPGISRSGTTIVTGLRLGLSREEAFRYSFFLSLPAIAGATLLEFMDVLKGTSHALPEGWILGVLASGLVGYFSLALLKKVVLFGKWRYFSIYCALLGVICLL